MCKCMAYTTVCPTIASKVECISVNACVSDLCGGGCVQDVHPSNTCPCTTLTASLHHHVVCAFIPIYNSTWPSAAVEVAAAAAAGYYAL
jgi:hypothetical protein